VNLLCSRPQYDLSVTTLSPDGKVFQVEYAMNATAKKDTCVGIRCVDGVVLGVEKIVLSKMMTKGSNRHIETVDKHIGMAMCGLTADGRQLVRKGREEAEEYRNSYGHLIPGNVLADRVAAYMHMHTLYWTARPFGCSVLTATYDEDNGPQLYMADPSGVCHRYFAAALGKHRQSAKSELEKLPLKTITCREAVVEVAKIIYKLHNDIKDKDFELELSWVCDESNRTHVNVPKDIYDSACAVAAEEKRKLIMAAEDSEEDD
jgi:20S proteasome subunit alpha 7